MSSKEGAAYRHKKLQADPSANYDPRTIEVQVAFTGLDNVRQVVFKDTATVDFARPQPWIKSDTIYYANWAVQVDCRIDCLPCKPSEFFPGEGKWPSILIDAEISLKVAGGPDGPPIEEYIPFHGRQTVYLDTDTKHAALFYGVDDILLARSHVGGDPSQKMVFCEAWSGYRRDFKEK